MRLRKTLSEYIAHLEEYTIPRIDGDISCVAISKAAKGRLTVARHTLVGVAKDLKKLLANDKETEHTPTPTPEEGETT